jgi:tetratricopeptide (TPR) repeat protein
MKALQKTTYVFLTITFFFVWFMVAEYPGKTTFRVIGLSGLTLTYLLFALFDKKEPIVNRLTYLTISLFSFTLFCKYYYWRFWDIPAILSIIAFIILNILSLNYKKKVLHLVTIFVIILISIPTFIPLIKFPARQIIPIRWYDRMHDAGEGIEVNIKEDYSNSESKTISEQAFKLQKLGAYKEAGELYLNAISVDTSSTKILFELAECYSFQNKLEEAVTIISKAIAIDSSYILFAQKGYYEYKIGNNQSAINNLKKAISLSPKPQYYIYYNLGLSYYSNNQKSEACNSLEKTLELNPEYLKNETFINIKQKACD